MSNFHKNLKYNIYKKSDEDGKKHNKGEITGLTFGKCNPITFKFIITFFIIAFWALSPLLYLKDHQHLVGFYETQPNTYQTPDGFTVHRNFRRSIMKPQNDDVTLVTQISIDKIPRLVDLVKNWKGPISCALFTNSIEDFAEKIDAAMKDNIDLKNNVEWQVVVSNDVEVPYPINIMRNVALDEAKTDFVFPIDVDFIPSPSTYDDLFFIIHDEVYRKNLEHKVVYVIPAFERHNNDGKVKMEQLPRNKTELLQAFPKKQIEPFHSYFYPGHGPTNFKKWYNASAPYSINWEPRFEPYVMGYRKHLPRYWDGFNGYGYNKLSWILELNTAGFQFQVLPYSFLIHINHKGRGERWPKTRMQDEYFHVFHPYLLKKYNVTDLHDVDYS